MGGHINPTEEADDDPIAAGLWRELSEEVTLSQITSLTCVGLINETTGGVSDYHTALVYLLKPQERSPSGRPKNVRLLGFSSGTQCGI